MCIIISFGIYAYTALAFTGAILNLRNVVIYVCAGAVLCCVVLCCVVLCCVVLCCVVLCCVVLCCVVLCCVVMCYDVL